jgi:glycosyltransferase involved in cell wall biosynthesis
MLISIEIQSRGERTLKEVLESIRTQSYQNYEILVMDCSDNFTSSDMARTYGAKVLRLKAKLLKGRFMLHKVARGENTLILDSTRFLRKDSLELLNKQAEDMVIIREKEVGRGILVKAANLDKRLIMTSANLRKALNNLSGFALPRFFRTSVLSAALESANRKLGSAMDKIMGGDHYVIFYESRRISTSIGVIHEPLIGHFTDGNPFAVMSKFYRYGLSYPTERRSYPESNFARMRDLGNTTPREKLTLYSLYLMRSTGFLAGYLHALFLGQLHGSR